MVRSLVTKKFAAKLKGRDEEDPEKLKAGEMRLYNFYQPSLQAGTYGIKVVQTVRAPGTPDPKIICNAIAGSTEPIMQRFEVVAPQFSLDPKMIDSYYPPAGHQDEAHILPHIVFNDPHVPWLRAAGTQKWMLSAIDTDGSGTSTTPSAAGKNFVPWLALMVFKPNDLLLSDDEASTSGVNLKGVKLIGSGFDANKPPSDGAYAMTVAEYLKLKYRVQYEAAEDFDELQTSDTPTKVIFPLQSQVQTVLGSKNDMTPLQAQKLMAHVRNINTVGFPDAGVEEEGCFSVVVSSMTGDVTEQAPTTHIVHVVSIEHLDSTELNSATARVGLVSLFSWSYVCLPEAINFEESMRIIGIQKQTLKPPQETLKALDTSGALYQRLDQGFTVSRWRVPTGEESIAFNRGPLVPVHGPGVPPTAADRPAWPALSMTGKDYMLFDESLGVMDVSYSAAWSMGKLLAISDSVFNAALMRLRSRIWNASASDVRKVANGIQGTDTLIGNGFARFDRALTLAAGGFSGTPERLLKPGDQNLVASPQLESAMTAAIHEYVRKAAASPASTPGDSLHNGLDGVAASSSDFEIVANWIYDCLYLGHMPAHVLFPEPSHLLSKNTRPVKHGQTTCIPEALRFFHIDHVWIDCFLDGALSCANHHEPEFDQTRLAIKRVINEVLDTEVGNTKLRPPVPRSGFVLRSAVVKKTPDLRLTVRGRAPGKDAQGQFSWIEDEVRDPLVRHTRLDDFTILSLLDCTLDEVYVVKLAQPPHQQRFAINLDANHQSVMKMKQLFTNPLLAPHVEFGADGKPTKDRDDALEWPELGWTADQSSFYDKSTRCIKPLLIAHAMNEALLAWGKKSDDASSYYTNATPSSAVLGLELNDSSCERRLL